jgi:hypothetical protein
VFCQPAQAQSQVLRPTNVLYDKSFDRAEDFPELLLEKGTRQFTKDGLRIAGNPGLVKLNKYYSLAERLVRYHVRFSKDCRAVFQSDKGDFKAYVDVAARQISIATNPLISTNVAFLDYRHDYLVEIHRHYATSSIRIIDLYTGQSAEISATMDGTGGVGRGAVGKGFFVGRQYDYYCFGLEKGSFLTVEQICVLSEESGLSLLIYGDSITEPEGYYPRSDFANSWTQLIMSHVKRPAMSSGRGGTTIKELLERIKNELPYIKANYVMVTIGTNGGNTEENLSELIEYILANGSVPILNNIPCNESGTQVKENALIEKIRHKYHIKGCRFDLATSLAHDGKEVDTSAMYFEDYNWGKIYHHPNVKGSLLMFTRTLVDIPGIYD